MLGTQQEVTTKSLPEKNTVNAASLNMPKSFEIRLFVDMLSVVIVILKKVL